MAIKDLKHGNYSKDNLDLLQSLTADYFSSRDPEAMKLLDAWNHLQNTPGKTRIFTFATKCAPGAIAKYLEQNYPFNRYPNDKGEYVWDTRPEKPYYAYIKHDNDTPGHVDPSDPESGIHYHFYLEYQNARTFASVATELGIPVTMLQSIKVSKKAVLQYLTHENDPKKHHYSLSDIHANFCVETARQEQEFDAGQLWQDYGDLRSGKMTYAQFYQKYQVYIVRHSFSQVLKTAETVWNASNYGEDGYYKRGGRL